MRPTMSRIYEDRASSSDIQYRGWPFMSVQFWGEPAEGRWTLSIGDASHDYTVYVFCRSFHCDILFRCDWTQLIAFVTGEPFKSGESCFILGP